MGIDILPAELPVESSQHFSEKLYPFIKEMVTQPGQSPLLRHSVIAEDGKLTEAHQGLKSYLSTTQKGPKKTVLLLGSGMVAAPLVEHLARRSDVNIVVASNVAEEAKALVSKFSNAESVPLDISDRQNLSALVGKADVVVR
ncbi:hypothetical protein RMCBS344292_01714 [Rhizopus microsporus]|nr:hypothetical protein RMCBS344292_01714 [Rhizopus microsporus]